ncbi:GNAT family N-acetyltransferase [Thermonema rossianum]|uniref:GNAT family N-acetyltransferase n=1 Tax=Thermonema rossianum TaxID=55505 RepID=UPI000571FFC0|nr:GNAT family N-acetyltransferase [Thermonema rossianum]
MQVEFVRINEACHLLRAMPIAFSPSLFCKEEYPLAYTGGEVFAGMAHDGNRLHALVYLYEGPRKCFFSPRFLTFGGWEGSARLSLADWQQLLQRTLTFLEGQGAAVWQVACPPDFYPLHTPPAGAWQALSRRVQIVEDLCHYLRVEDRPLRALMSRGQRRYLNMPRRYHWHLRRYPASALDITRWNEFYSLLELNRQARNIPLSITYERLIRSAAIAKEAMQLFELRDTDDRLLAATLALRVHPQVIYYFLPVCHPQYYVFSPMVPLLNAIYEYARQEGISFLDLGISSVKGIVNQGLSAFKERLSAKRGCKNTLIISL